MATATLDDVIELAGELDPQDRAVLLLYLRRDGAAVQRAFTRTAILAEHQWRKAHGAFERSESMLGRFARPELALDYETIEAILHEAGTAWEQELGEFST